MKNLIDNVMDILGDRLETGCDSEDVAICISSLIGFHHGFGTLGPITDDVIQNLTANGFEIRQ